MACIAVGIRLGPAIDSRMVVASAAKGFGDTDLEVAVETGRNRHLVAAGGFVGRHDLAVLLEPGLLLSQVD